MIERLEVFGATGDLTALTGIGARTRTFVPLTLTAQVDPPELPAYGRLLLEAEEAWRVVTPVLSAWAAGIVPLEEYPAGSDGPRPRGDAS
jgi:glucose-6-phosphate 1-dehydrogenase